MNASTEIRERLDSDNVPAADSPLGSARLTVNRDEIVRALGVSRHTLRRLEREGRLSPIPGLTSKEKRYRAADVRRFVELGSAVAAGSGN